MTAQDSAYAAAIAYAEKRGREDGTNAAGWYTQDTFRDAPAYAAAYVLRGLEDGDPAVMDTLPHADLSGEWADSLTGPALVADAIVHADDWTMTRAEWVAYWEAHDPFTDVCDAYELAFDDAAADAIAAAAREVLA